MDRIEQAIQESLLESYLYRESTGEALLTDDWPLRKSISRRTVCKAVVRKSEEHTIFFRRECISPSCKVNPVKRLDLPSLEDYFQSVLLQELQKMRTE